MPEVGLREARTLVLRLWFEDSRVAEEREWRGEVRDVLTDRVVYFRKLAALGEAVAGLLAHRDGTDD